MSAQSIPSFLTGNGEMAGHFRAFDWASTPLGVPHCWPQALQSTVRLMLSSGHPMLIWWGKDRISLYNDAHAPALTPLSHPGALGRRGQDSWPEGWKTIGPQIDRILSGEGSTWHQQKTLPIASDETKLWTYSMSAIGDPDAPGGVGGVLLISFDATADVQALKAANTQLAVLEAERVKADHASAQMRAIFEASPHFMSLLAPDGTLLDANTVSLTAIGTTLADVAGKKFAETPWFAGTPGSGDRIAADVALAAAGGSVRHEMQLNLATGSRIFEFTIHPVRNAAGEIIYLAPEAVELTELREAEEKRRQIQKMEAVGQLAGGLAHDFNNLLTGISGSLDLLKTRLSQGRYGDADRYITAAETSATRAAALTHRLLAFSRRQTLDPKPTQANQLITEMENSLRRIVEPRVLLRTSLFPGLWTNFCDAQQLENVILNLCLNARDAMPDGGTLTIETDNIMLDERQARARDMQPGAYVGIFVTDTGNGMSPDVAARAFDPFFTTKPIGMGTGLGLSMIYGFTQQSGGQVRIHSAVGQGTTMRLFLPRYHIGEPEEAMPAPVQETRRALAGETVLVVDDEPTVRMLVVEVLEEMGYTALEASDGAAGLKMLQSPVQIDLLITDVGLPGGMNGRQMADAARQHRADLKVLFITGYAETAVVGNGSLEPGMEVMTKPFSLDLLATRIKAMIAG